MGDCFDGDHCDSDANEMIICGRWEVGWGGVKNDFDMGIGW